MKILPDSIKDDLLIDKNSIGDICEIRLRINQRCIAVCCNREIVGSNIVTKRTDNENYVYGNELFCLCI